MENNKKNSPDFDGTGEIMSWIITFILTIAFWPVGLIMLLKKLNVIGKNKTSANENQSAEEWSDSWTGEWGSRDAPWSVRNSGSKNKNNTKNAEAKYKEAARSAEAAAREVAAEIAKSAREAGQAVRQSINEIYSDFSREFSQNKSPRQQQQSQQEQKQQQPSQEQKQSHQRDEEEQQSQLHRKAHQEETPEGWSSVSSYRDPNAQTQQTQQTQQAQTQQMQQTQQTQQQTKQAYSTADRRNNAYTQSSHSNAAWSATSAQTKTKKTRSVLDKKSGRAISFILLIISTALIILGANTIAGASRDIWINNLNRWPDFLLGVFYFFGGLVTLFARTVGVRRLARYKRYYQFVSGYDAVAIGDIARATGRSERVAKRDLQAMINDGYLGWDAYIDSKRNYLILTAAGAEEVANSMGGIWDSVSNAATPGTQSASSSGGASVASNDGQPQNQYMAIMLELREINNSIADVVISEKVDKIEELTGKIFRAVEDSPEKLPQIRRFMTYYLPTTQKLLRSYATLEKQGIKGENITTTKDSIGRILDTLASGFEQQLDQLFSSDAIDIASDINVLESLMQQDGLTGDRPVMAASGAAGSSMGSSAAMAIAAEPEPELKSMEGV
ncbi:MAG: 5-bromo-4-chloroindolyl phosphate hydrolysis family protein [Oscillospiraceae bacterium]|nr:5-bromo-4-chloroindolyl phosphate hydrolysis family protein [Oscillospiraceae bacterium]